MNLHELMLSALLKHLAREEELQRLNGDLLAEIEELKKSQAPDEEK